jgi:ABC-type transporter Mla subunit MlaD
MHKNKHSHRHGRRCHGLGRGRVPNAGQLLEQLEEHQRDLEQEVADVADLIRRLKEQRPETASV